MFKMLISITYLKIIKIDEDVTPAILSDILCAI